MSDEDIRPYVESNVIMTTVRIISPFLLTFGLFLILHGADSSGGGFQGGAIIAATVVMLAFAFGIEPTRRWLSNYFIIILISGGLMLFISIGIGSLILGDAFLDYSAYGYNLTKYLIEIIEICIGAIVTGILSGLFFAIARGFEFRRGEE